MANDYPDPSFQIPDDLVWQARLRARAFERSDCQVSRKPGLFLL
ncbi:MAG: hypothetical protein ABI588_09855 [Arenimonas sp.]